MERVYQCVKCGLVFRSKKQIVSHLVNTEKVNPLAVDYFYQTFFVRVKELNKII